MLLSKNPLSEPFWRVPWKNWNASLSDDWALVHVCGYEVHRGSMLAAARLQRALVRV